MFQQPYILPHTIICTAVGEICGETFSGEYFEVAVLSIGSRWGQDKGCQKRMRRDRERQISNEAIWDVEGIIHTTQPFSYFPDALPPSLQALGLLPFSACSLPAPFEAPRGAYLEG